MRLNPDELIGLDDSSIGALIRTGLLDDGINVMDEMEELSDAEKEELLGSLPSEGDTAGMDYRQCSSCSTLVMFSKGTIPPANCAKCGGEIQNTLENLASGVPTQTIIFNINGDKMTSSQLSSENVDGHSEEDEPLQFGETLTIKDVPIFAAGTHNGVPYTEDDIDTMVNNFSTLEGKVIPPLKLGHGGQKIIKTKGMPAAGWMESLRRDGKFLLATFKQVPKRIASLIKDGAWKRPSAEIYKNFKDSAGKEYGYVVAAVALLGSDPPAVKELPAWDSLPEIEKLYNSSLDSNDVTIVDIQFEDDVNVSFDKLGRSEEEMGSGADEQMETRFKKIEEEMATQKLEHETKMQEMQEQVTAAQTSAMTSSMSVFIEKAKKEGKITPAVEEKVMHLATILETSATHKYSEKDDKGEDVEKELTALDLFKEIIEGLPKSVDFDEQSTGDEVRNGKTTSEEVDGETFETKKGKNETLTETQVHAEVLKYCEDKKWDPEDADMYSEAYIAVSKDDPTIS